MNHLKSYLDQLDSRDLKNSINDTVLSVIPTHIKTFSYKEHITGLLLGNVQSGKTGQMFGLAAATADEGFEIFVLLTTDNVYLQQQTFQRALEKLDTFNVCGEDDEVRFMANKLKKPLLLILKKNTNVLQKWRNNLAASGYCVGRPIFILDDEADAASLNTKVNKKEISQINSHLDNVKKLSSSSIYVQVTATPQAILLQTKVSGWKPSFVHYFMPGKDYLGGNFFYSEPKSFTIRTTGESELDDLRQPSEFIPEGLRLSLMSFLVTIAHIRLTDGKVCNFLIHPSVSIADHETVADKIGEFLNLLLSSLTEKKMRVKLQVQLREAWVDLQKSKPDIKNFEDIVDTVHKILDEENIKLIVMNSKGTPQFDYSKGFNIIIGGNSLGRGVTFPVLQTVYYCRKSKIPQADTFWQHCRMFGYDREPGLMRIYIPALLLKLFTDLNNANQILINQINSIGLDEVSLLYPPNIKPSRQNVIDKKFLNIIVGGVNYFPSEPKRKAFDVVEELLKPYDDRKDYHLTDSKILISVLENLESESKSDWNNKEVINCIKTLREKRPNIKTYIILRRNRDIQRGTGTLLSPNDRKLGDSFSEATVLTLYRLNGTKDKGWGGHPIWIPNIKFPEGLCFYKMEEGK
jgi:hypothetical protein